MRALGFQELGGARREDANAEPMELHGITPGHWDNLVMRYVFRSQTSGDYMVSEEGKNRREPNFRQHYDRQRRYPKVCSLLDMTTAPPADLQFLEPFGWNCLKPDYATVNAPRGGWQTWERTLRQAGVTLRPIAEVMAMPDPRPAAAIPQRATYVPLDVTEGAPTGGQTTGGTALPLRTESMLRRTRR